MTLLLPEWQGFGLHADAAGGADALAALLFDGGADLIVDAPRTENLSVADGVLGLSSIAQRLRVTSFELARHAPDRVTMIGGTCAVELAPLSYLNNRYNGDLAVLWLDAHADLNTPASSPSAHLHGMVLRTLMGDGHASLTEQIARPLTPGQVALVGARDFDPPETEFIRANDIRVFSEDMFLNPASVVEWLRAWKHVYVHFDVDVLDPARFRSALMNAPGGGPSVEDAVSFIAALQTAVDVVGLSIVEFVDRDAATTRQFAESLRLARVL